MGIPPKRNVPTSMVKRSLGIKPHGARPAVLAGPTDADTIAPVGSIKVRNGPDRALQRSGTKQPLARHLGIEVEDALELA